MVGKRGRIGREEKGKERERGEGKRKKETRAPIDRFFFPTTLSILPLLPYYSEPSEEEGEDGWVCSRKRLH